MTVPWVPPVPPSPVTRVPPVPGAAIVGAVFGFVLAAMAVVGAVYAWLAGGVDAVFRGGGNEHEANLVAALALLVFFPLVGGGVLLLLRVDRWVLVAGAAGVLPLAVYWAVRGATVLDSGDPGWRVAAAVVYAAVAVVAGGCALAPAVGQALAEHRTLQRTVRARQEWQGNR